MIYRGIEYKIFKDKNERYYYVIDNPFLSVNVYFDGDKNAPKKRIDEFWSQFKRCRDAIADRLYDYMNNCNDKDLAMYTGMYNESVLL